MFVKQVIDFSAVYFVHGNCDREVALVVLPIIDAALEKIFDRNALYAIHGVCFARSRLAVCKYCDDALVEDEIENGSDLIKIELFI